MLSVRLHPQRGPCRPSRNVLAASSRGGGLGGHGIVGGRGQRQEDAKISRGDEALDPKDTRASASNLSDDDFDDFDDFDDDYLPRGSYAAADYDALSPEEWNKVRELGPDRIVPRNNAPPGSKHLRIQLPVGDKHVTVTLSNQSQLDALLERTSSLGLSDDVPSADTESDQEDVIFDFDILADEMSYHFVMKNVDDIDGLSSGNDGGGPPKGSSPEEGYTPMRARRSSPVEDYTSLRQRRSSPVQDYIPLRDFSLEGPSSETAVIFFLAAFSKLLSWLSPGSVEPKDPGILKFYMTLFLMMVELLLTSRRDHGPYDGVPNSGPLSGKRLRIQQPLGKWTTVKIYNQSQLDALLLRTSSLGLSDEILSADTENDQEDLIVDFDILADAMNCRFVMMDVDDFYKPVALTWKEVLEASNESGQSLFRTQVVFCCDEASDNDDRFIVMVDSSRSVFFFLCGVTHSSASAHTYATMLRTGKLSQRNWTLMRIDFGDGQLSDSLEEAEKSDPEDSTLSRLKEATDAEMKEVLEQADKEWGGVSYVPFLP